MLVGDVPWPPLTGFRLQVRHLALELAPRHEVCLLGYRWPDQRELDIPGVEVRPVDAPSLSLAARARVLPRSAITGAPTAVGLYTDGLRTPLREVLAERSFDLVYASGANLAGLRPFIGELPMVVGALDAWHLNMRAAIAVESGLRRLLRQWEELQARRLVAHIFAGVARVVMVSEADAAAIRELNPRLSPVVIPNGVDSDSFTPEPTAAEPGRLVFTGALSYAPNVLAATWLVERILPLIQEQIPAARLSVVGRAPAPEVRQLADHPGVEVHADVPDIRTWLRRGSVYMCPMTSGTGIKNKLLEAMSCGLPAVATPLACQGMDVRDGAEVLLGDTPEELAAAAVHLLRDAELRLRLGRAARDYVLAHHTWSGVATAFEEVFREAIATQNEPARAR